ncbi:MAG: hypothetical protein A2156_14145 [Deltaproteobacteria bacterium RBG_16_48_10]|nr:MAG: hypothetical protein A2156_14145 [Deltaproteobacteria bacterium RBG_16_48_10]
MQTSEPTNPEPPFILFCALFRAMKTKLMAKNMNKKTKPLLFINPPPLFPASLARVLDFTSLALLHNANSWKKNMSLDAT